MNKNIFKPVIVGVLGVSLLSFLVSSCTKKTPTLNAPVPTASFTYNMLTPSDAAAQNLELVNTSTNSMTGYWSVTDDGGNTVGTYTGDTVKLAVVFAGTYNVKMAAGGPGGLSDTIKQTVTIANNNPYAVGPTTLLGVLTGAALGKSQRTWIPERVVNSVIVWDNYSDCLGQINGGGGAWWAFGAAEIAPRTGRDGYLDDQYTFTFAKTGQFIYNDNNTVYLDNSGSGWTTALPSPWNGYLGTFASTRDSSILSSSQVIGSTNTPVSITTAVYNVVPALKPWGSGTFGYTLASAPAGAMKLGTVTVNGLGAHIGLPDKAASGDETTAVTVTSNTYDVLKVTTGLKDATTGATYDEIVLGLQESWGVWTYMFRSDR